MARPSPYPAELRERTVRMVAEVRPNYPTEWAAMKAVAVKLAIGTCGVGDLALVAAATVISVPAPDRFVLDVGSKVLGTDRSPWVMGHGYLPQFPQGTITGLWEHHAVVRLPEGVRGPHLGALVAVVPNHMCTPVNLADELLVVRDREVIDRWQVTARGANT